MALPNDPQQTERFVAHLAGLLLRLLRTALARLALLLQLALQARLLLQGRLQLAALLLCLRRQRQVQGAGRSPEVRETNRASTYTHASRPA